MNSPLRRSRKASSASAKRDTPRSRSLLGLDIGEDPITPKGRKVRRKLESGPAHGPSRLDPGAAGDHVTRLRSARKASFSEGGGAPARPLPARLLQGALRRGRRAADPPRNQALPAPPSPDVGRCRRPPDEEGDRPLGPPRARQTAASPRPARLGRRRASVSLATER